MGKKPRHAFVRVAPRRGRASFAQDHLGLDGRNDAARDLVLRSELVGAVPVDVPCPDVNPLAASIN